MDKFSALAVPTRRSIIELLAQHGRMTASNISEQFDATPSAISQHLKALREADFIKMESNGQQRIYELNPLAIEEMAQWAMKLNARFQRLDKFLEREKKKLLTKK
jgi:DNA-binding transcriptional ArsR family regulator